MGENLLFIDIETYSSIDLVKSGVYKYTESPDFEILLLAYARGENEVKIIDLTKENIPSFLILDLLDPKIKKIAHNANFERVCLSKINVIIDPRDFICTQVKSAYCGLPLSLENVSKVLELDSDNKGKLSTGKALIKHFCIPQKNNKRNLPSIFPEKWEQFKNYCIRDVIAEREIYKHLINYELPQFEKINYIIDQKINDRGVLLDPALAQNSILITNEFNKDRIEHLHLITELTNPNSPAQLKTWISNRLKTEIKSLTKESIIKLKSETEDEAVRDVLETRLLLAKTSIKKYDAMINCENGDHRLRGLFQFYGASRTGRWSGRLVQLQNLPQNHMSDRDLDLARKMVLHSNLQDLMLVFDKIPFVISELIRTSFIPSLNNVLIVSDFNSIEARVLAWVAGEEWRLKVFETHGKIYEASASMMFNVPIDEIKKGSDLRQKGKTAELALGYQGSLGAMKAMGADKMGLNDMELQNIVKRWRNANKKIVKFWDDLERSVTKCILSGITTKMNYLSFEYDGKNLMICLPSGRKLYYNNPKIGYNKWGKRSIQFWGMNQDIKKWDLIDTYGGKLAENIVQAISRDVLAYSMQTLENNNFNIVMHIHDEVVIDTLKSKSKENYTKIVKLMTEDIPWAPGLILKAEGSILDYYKKD